MSADRDTATPATVVVNPQGRVTIPVQLRRAAGIDVGSRLLAHVEGGRIILESRDVLAARLRADVAAAWQGPLAVSPAAELIRERRAEAAAEADRT